MKKFLKNILIYFLTVGILLFVYFQLGTFVAEKCYGVNTKQQIEFSFANADAREYNKLFLGNSRVYRGINPDMIDGHTYNFAHDNDSYNQCYYKLKHVLDGGHKIDTLFIGADYFQFSIFARDRNYIYDYLLDNAYCKDYNESYLTEQVENAKQLFYNKQTLLLTALTRIALHQEVKGKIKSNGQFTFDSKAKPDDAVERKTDVRQIQKKYYNEIVELCHKNNIRVIAFTMPVREGEMQSYTKEDIARIQDIIKAPLSNGDQYVDMTCVDEFRDYKDYTDITHLNAAAADRFTVYFYNRVKKS